MIRILYIGLKYDYGIVANGPSYEHENLYDTLKRMPGVDVSLFPFDEVMRNMGRDGLNAKLKQTVESIDPDVCFFVLFTDEISKETIRWITEKSGSATLNWFTDDHWRFESFSKFWAPSFHWVVTTDPSSMAKYRNIGCSKTILSQWAFNHYEVKRSKIQQAYDVTFVGSVHSDRKKMIQHLQASGIPVRCWGNGWENGRLGREEMFDIFSRSKINLNFAEGSSALKWKPMTKAFIHRRADDSFVVNSIPEMIGHLKVLMNENPRQIKGRNFEIPGAGGFLLTGAVENLENYYIPGKEVAVFKNSDDLVEKIRYYLSNDRERERIRRAGQTRTLRDHTFEKRFRDIFATIGLMSRRTNS